MTEYIKREDAKRVVRELFKDLPTRIEVNTLIDLIPAANIKKGDGLRCERCRFYQWVNATPVCLKYMSSVFEPDDYCSKAEPIPDRDCAWK